MSLIIMEFIQSKEQQFKFKYYSFIFIIDYEHRDKLDNLRHIINSNTKFKYCVIFYMYLLNVYYIYNLIRKLGNY